MANGFVSAFFAKCILWARHLLCEEKCASFDTTEAVKLAPSVTFVRSIETHTDNFEDDLCDRTQQSC